MLFSSARGARMLSRLPLSHMTRATVPAKDHAEAHKRVFALYVEFMRAAPSIASKYTLDVHPSRVRAAIKERFRANAHETDLDVINAHLFRGYQELEETLMMWKVKAHVARMLPPVVASSPSMGLPKGNRGERIEAPEPELLESDTPEEAMAKILGSA